MKVSFVIPSYNHPELINQLLCDIRDNCTPDEVIVVDDFSTNGAAIDMLEWWAKNYDVRVLRTPEDLGFLRTSNFGLKQVSGDIVCLISTDESEYCLIARAMQQIEGKILLKENIIMKVRDGTFQWIGGRIFLM
jgi:glycosyltransferase involved in cell wall biosynthesis